MSDLPGARVLVTGATGFLGRRLLRVLSARGATVHRLTRGDQETAGSRARACNDSSVADDPRACDAVTVHVADLADPDALAAVLASVGPDVVFHLAVARGETTPEQRETLWRVNALGTVALLKAAASAGCRRFVHAGSSQEYGGLAAPFRESDVLCPNTAFGASKAAATVAVGQFGASGRLDTVNLRIFSVYGPGEPAYRLVPSAIRAALNGETLPLTADGPVRDFVFVDDVCDALVRAATAGGLPAGCVFNVGTGVQTSNHALVDAVERVVGRPIARAVGTYQPHATDKGSWCADPTLAREVLGWEAKTVLEDGIALHAEDVRAALGHARGITPNTVPGGGRDG